MNFFRWFTATVQEGAKHEGVPAESMDSNASVHVGIANMAVVTIRQMNQ